MTVTFELREGAEVSPEENRALENAKKLPVVYDDDSPELTEAMEQALICARREKPYQKTLDTARKLW